MAIKQGIWLSTSAITPERTTSQTASGEAGSGEHQGSQASWQPLSHLLLSLGCWRSSGWRCLDSAAPLTPVSHVEFGWTRARPTPNRIRHRDCNVETAFCACLPGENKWEDGGGKVMQIFLFQSLHRVSVQMYLSN